MVSFSSSCDHNLQKKTKEKEIRERVSVFKKGIEVTCNLGLSVSIDNISRFARDGYGHNITTQRVTHTKAARMGRKLVVDIIACATWKKKSGSFAKKKKRDG